jgi:hypothetical protein
VGLHSRRCLRSPRRRHRCAHCIRGSEVSDIGEALGALSLEQEPGDLNMLQARTEPGPSRLVKDGCRCDRAANFHLHGSTSLRLPTAVGTANLYFHRRVSLKESWRNRHTGSIEKESFEAFDFAASTGRVKEPSGSKLREEVIS